jgi:D-alanyl-D-alanine dipeptidase
MTREAAIALKNVNSDLAKDGYRIVIYDSYRPQKTVNRFVEWSLDDNAVSEKQKYYPQIDKIFLFEQGYIAKKSGHTRGSTVDLSIIKIGTPLKPVVYRLR